MNPLTQIRNTQNATLSEVRPPRALWRSGAPPHARPAARLRAASATAAPGTRGSSTLRASAFLRMPPCSRSQRRRSYIYAGGLPYDLTEGDLLAIFSQARGLRALVTRGIGLLASRCPWLWTEGVAALRQYGEVVDVNLVRDAETGKGKGFAFLAYEDQRSTVLAVDNLSGAKVLSRTLRVEHVDDYKLKRKEARPAGRTHEFREEKKNPARAHRRSRACT